MNHAHAVGTIQSFRKFQRELQRRPHWELSAVSCQQVFQRLATHKFHYDVRRSRFWLFAGVKDGYDSRMRETARSLCFAEETFAVCDVLFCRLASQRNGLYGHHAVDPGIPGLVHHAHGSPTNFGEDLVSSKTLTTAIIHRYSHTRVLA